MKKIGLMKNKFMDFVYTFWRKVCNNKFLLASLGLTCLGGIFHFWIAYPGFLSCDGIMYLFNRDNLQPIVSAYFFTLIFFLFGYHVWLAFLFLIIPFYLSLWLIVFSFYRRYKSWWALLCFFPIFIQTIFLQPWIIISTSFEALYSFLLYTSLLCYIMVPIKKKRICLIFLMIISYVFALFARHNGIVQIFPAIACIACLIIKETSIWKFLLKYVGVTFVLVVFSYTAKIIIDNTIPSYNLKKPNQLVLTNQLAAMCVPENDASCFDESWFMPDKSFEDMKRVYQAFPLTANHLGYFTDNSGMNIHKIRAEGIEKKWLQAIVKYPKNYFKHEFELIKALWFAPIHFIEYSPKGPKSPFYEKFNYEGAVCSVPERFPEDERYMHETQLKKRLLHIWDDYLPKINTMFWIYYMLLTGIISAVLLFYKQRQKTLIYCFHLSWGGLIAAVLYGMFHPEPAWRYVQILWVFGIGNTFALLSYVLDMIIVYKANRRADNGI